MGHSPLNAVGVWFCAQDTGRNLYLMRNDKRYRGTWGLPGGKVEPGESLLEAINRECKEEMGWMPRGLKIIPVEKFTADHNRFVFHTFFCIVPHEFIPRLNHEHIGYAWVNADTIPKPLHPGFWQTLKIDDVVEKINTLKDLYITV